MLDSPAERILGLFNTVNTNSFVELACYNFCRRNCPLISNPRSSVIRIMRKTNPLCFRVNRSHKLLSNLDHVARQRTSMRTTVQP